MNRIIAIARVVCLELLRQKALYVLAILLAALLLTIASVDVFGMGGAVRHILDLGLLMVWILSWGTAVLVAVRQLPRAEKSGAVYSLLARPLSRAELLLGKWLGAWLLTATATLVFMLVVILVVVSHGGALDPTTLFQAMALHLTALAIICATGISLSVAMGEDAALAATLLVTAGSFYILPRLPYMLASIQGWSAVPAYLFHYMAPHLEWFDLRRRLIHGWGPAPWKAFITVIIYGLLWTASALLLGWLGYRRKPFNRSV